MFNTFINIGNQKWIIFLTFPFYEVSNANIVINLLCCCFGNALVSTSTTMSSIEQYLNVTLPFSIHFLTKWCCTSMCFVRTCWLGLFINDIAPWLSHQITLIEINQNVTIPFTSTCNLYLFATRFGNICNYKTNFQLFSSFSHLWYNY